MQIKYREKLTKVYAKAPIKIQKAFDKKMQIFMQNPFDRQLNNHALKGKLKPYRSIDITGDWRAWYIIEDNIVWVDILGTHSQLYK
ncbi:MAG: type II toxin-antitoxin system mRNA interferase toxin, RelE/StbE family [Patescibacteria group bacterium]